MSVFITPQSRSGTSKDFQVYKLVSLLSPIPLLIIGAGIIGCILRASQLMFYASVLAAGILTTVLLQLVLRAVAERGGIALLDQMYDDPAQRVLYPLLEQLPDVSVLLQPVLRVGADVQPFSLATVSAQGITFVRTARSPGNPNVAEVKAVCVGLSEQHSLPLLGRVRFVQLINSASEPKLGSDWQPCMLRDFTRLYERGDSQPTPEMAKALRALYDLALPAQMTPVPVAGSLPPAKSRVDHRTPGRRRHNGKPLLFLAKLGVFFIVAAIVVGLGLYALQLYEYEMAEKVMAPSRALLRRYLPHEWQLKLHLGREMVLNEAHLYAKLNKPMCLSETIELGGTGPSIEPGQEVQIVHSEKGRYFVRWRQKNVGWLPGDALTFRHLLPAGTLLYSRPDAGSEPKECLASDSPVAVLSVRTIPMLDRQIVWSKVTFLDKKEIYYVQGKI